MPRWLQLQPAGGGAHGGAARSQRFDNTRSRSRISKDKRLRTNPIKITATWRISWGQTGQAAKSARLGTLTFGQDILHRDRDPANGK